MRKVIILAILLAVTAWGTPFNTVPAYTLKPDADYFGLQIPGRIPLQGEEALTAYPMIWTGFGVIPDIDVNFMMLTGIEPGDTAGYAFNFYYLMAETRYEALKSKNLSLTPVLELFIPLDEVQTVGLGPGLMASAGTEKFEFHANLLSNVNVIDFSADLFFFISPEVYLNPDVTVFAEANLSASLKEGEFSNAFELWAGASWEPTYWLSLCAACGIPPDLSYLSPGLAAYASF